MSRRVRRNPQVKKDILEIARYIARDNLDAGLRFFDAIEQTFLKLAEMPGMGAIRGFENPKFSDAPQQRRKDACFRAVFLRHERSVLLLPISGTEVYCRLGDCSTGTVCRGHSAIARLLDRAFLGQQAILAPGAPAMLAAVAVPAVSPFCTTHVAAASPAIPAAPQDDLAEDLDSPLQQLLDGEQPVLD